MSETHDQPDMPADPVVMPDAPVAPEPLPTDAPQPDVGPVDPAIESPAADPASDSIPVPQAMPMDPNVGNIVFQQEPVAPQPEPEPTMDTSGFHMVAGEISDIIAHMKEWVMWRMRNSQ